VVFSRFASLHRIRSVARSREKLLDKRQKTNSRFLWVARSLHRIRSVAPSLALCWLGRSGARSLHRIRSVAPNRLHRAVWFLGRFLCRSVAPSHSLGRSIACTVFFWFVCSFGGVPRPSLPSPAERLRIKKNRKKGWLLHNFFYRQSAILVLAGTLLSLLGGEGTPHEHFVSWVVLIPKCNYRTYDRRHR